MATTDLEKFHKVASPYFDGLDYVELYIKWLFKYQSIKLEKLPTQTLAKKNR